MTFKNIFSLTLLSLIIFFSSCKKEETNANPVTGLTKTGSGFAVGAATKVDIYTNTAAIQSGFQKFFFVLTDSITGNYIDDAQIKLTPMMDMGTMKHSSPYENPASQKAGNHLFEGSVFFIMSSMGGTWTIDVNVLNKLNNKEGKFTIPVTVQEPAQKRMLSFTSAVDNTSRYFVGLVQPSKPKVGINDLELVIYKRQNMMSFPADSALSLTFEPEMPTMNHGSPNNVNPVHKGNGHYKGKVNFTMTGLWRLHFTLKAGDAIAKTDSLDIEF
ncbi:MAG: FixH family protein [Chitinophagaceae bacterium]|nr:FixH family protein [Chitinophagaceae bacterium]